MNITDFRCYSCGPQSMIGDYGSKTHVLCLQCGGEIDLQPKKQESDMGPSENIGKIERPGAGQEVEIRKLKAENERLQKECSMAAAFANSEVVRLKAELEAMKPKPVTTHLMSANRYINQYGEDVSEDGNWILHFHCNLIRRPDGKKELYYKLASGLKVISAEVLNQGGVK